ncbi:hypothetical protein [Aliidiomarina sanyensis]|uniref:Uncharacterized protein n=1 Tax=Aliidiomarina sanyensis TaxID=1249555 RepID=A0A432W4Z4_9GAMM|nr:hypothetical protein [Aliidiomarina sanyensis]RUO24931.1 hypothetical protein CWE11_11955 [Aliidiomarina sanyensis]
MKLVISIVIYFLMVASFDRDSHLNTPFPDFYKANYKKLTTSLSNYVENPDQLEKLIVEHAMVRYSWNSLFENQYDDLVLSDYECRFWLAYWDIQGVTYSLESGWQFGVEKFEERAIELVALLKEQQELTNEDRLVCRYFPVKPHEVSMIRLLDEPSTYIVNRVIVNVFLNLKGNSLFGYFLAPQSDPSIRKIRIPVASVNKGVVLQEGAARIEGRLRSSKLDEGESNSLYLEHVRSTNLPLDEEISLVEKESIDPMFVDFIKDPKQFFGQEVQLSGFLKKDYRGRATLFLSNFHAATLDDTNAIWVLNQSDTVFDEGWISLKGVVVDECHLRHSRAPALRICLAIGQD